MIRRNKNQKEVQTKPYEYKRVNFLDAFRKLGFAFLENEPRLLVEKIHSVDPDWIGHANYTAYGSHSYEEAKYTQSTATNVPCLEGEWMVVCYSKQTKRSDTDGDWYGSEWHKYYLCQIDFSQTFFFKVVKEFDHIYDAFQYLCDNKLVALIKSDTKFQKQISIRPANMALSVLGNYEQEYQTFSYNELQEFFAIHAINNEEVVKFLKKYDFIPMENGETDVELVKEMIERKVKRRLPIEPYKVVGHDEKLSIKEYLDMIREFKENYLWNT